MAGVTWRSWIIVSVLILITGYAACDVSLQASNVTEKYQYNFSRSDTSSINETVTITITATDDLIHLELFSSEKLSNQACAEGPIQLYTGQARLLLGSYCGEDDVFSSSHPVLVIVVNTTSLPDNIEINFLYKDMGKSAFITSARTPRYLYTSNYPDGGSLYDSKFWRITKYDGASPSSTVFVTLKYADEDYKPDCALSNVTLYLFYGGPTKYFLQKNHVWCGQHSTFSNTNRRLFIISSGQTLLESGLKIKIWTEEVTECKQEVANTADLSVIQSPGFPNGYPEHTNCRWYAALFHTNTYGYYLVKVVEVDINCENDALGILYTGPDLKVSRRRLECENEPHVMEYYADYLQVLFISGPQTNSSHKGFNMTVQRLNNTSCYTELEAAELRQMVSPNVTAPGHGICKWVFRTTNPVFVVKIQIRNYNAWCKHKKNRIYDGLTEDRYSALNDVCGHGFYQSTGGNLLIVMSDMTGTFGEEIEFWEGQYSQNLTDTTGLVTYPFQKGNYKRDADVTWTIRSAPSERIGVTFDLMDVHCGGDIVSISDGEDIWGLCGSQDRRFLSKTNTVVINFRSITDQGTGFRMRYYDHTITACGDSVVDVPINRCQFESPSSYYFDNLLCKWRISSSGGKVVKLIITVDDIKSKSSKECDQDYLQVYNGNSKLSPAISPRVCGVDKEVTLTSSGKEMYVEFITDSVLSGTGFKARCEEITPPENGLSTGIIVAIVVLLVGLLALGCVVYICMKRKRRREGNLAQTTTPLSEAQPFSPPPSYDDRSPNYLNGLNAPPPTYDDVVKTPNSTNSQTVTSSL